MSFEVYDFRSVDKNVLVTPEIRARLYHMKPGQVDNRHSHDLGHEIFLILEGQAEFNIEGTIKVLGPGQMCVALADEIHQVRNLLPDKETIMYLSVTPHIQPTHTGRTADDEKMPPQFRANSGYDDSTDLAVPVDALIDKHLAASAAMVQSAQESLAVQQQMAESLRSARAEGDEAGVEAARNAMWDAIYTVHKQVYALGSAWNELSPRAADEE